MGHIISVQGNSMDAHKVKTIQDWPDTSMHAGFLALKAISADLVCMLAQASPGCIMSWSAHCLQIFKALVACSSAQACHCRCSPSIRAWIEGSGGLGSKGAGSFPWNQLVHPDVYLIHRVHGLTLFLLCPHFAGFMKALC